MTDTVATQATSAKAQTISYDTSIAIVLLGQAERSKSSALSLIIDSPEMLELASEDLRKVKTLQNEVEAKRTSITQPLNQVLRSINDLFRQPATFLEDAEKSLKASILAYTTEQERLAEIARKEAEERARIERERLAAEERELLARQQAAEAEANALAAAGDTDGAAAAQARAIELEEEAVVAAVTSNVVTIAPVYEAPVRSAGISRRTTYAAEVTDLMELVRAVAAGKAPLEAIQANTQFLGMQAKAFKREGQLYAGVNIIANKTLAARAA